MVAGCGLKGAQGKKKGNAGQRGNGAKGQK